MGKRLKSLALLMLLAGTSFRVSGSEPGKDGGVEVGVQKTAGVQPLPADVSFMIVDLKYHDGSPSVDNPMPTEKRVTVLEFGDGLFAGFKVLDHMCYEGIVWDKLWHYAHDLGLPLWYVGDYSSGDKRVAWDTFKAFGGRHVPTLRLLEYDQYFRELGKGQWESSMGATRKNYKGLVVFKRLPQNHSPQGKREIEAFKRRHPQFLYLSDSVTKYVSDKRLADELFATDELRRFRPRCKFYPKEYTPTLASRIAADLGCKYFVIKPVNSGRGNGVLMVSEKELDKTLAIILRDYKNHLPPDNEYSFKIDPPMLHQYWRYDRNTHFLVEEYAQSKDLWFDDKPYDPTMRVAFTMHHENGEVAFTWLDAYWKRPIKALTDEGNFREKHISRHAPNAQESLGWEVSLQDQESIKELLVPMMHDLYKRMLERRDRERRRLD